MPPPRRRGQRFGPLISAAAVSLVVTTAATPAQAAPTPDRVPSSAALDRLTQSGAPSHRYDITLITGDTVHVTASNGHYQTTMDLAPRPDGRQVTVNTLAGGGHTYLLPSDAAELVAAGRVDRGLFDVTRLIADGYANDRTGTLPVIVQYPGKGAAARSPQAEPRLRAEADALPASTPVRTLESINGVALTVTKDAAAAFWSALSPPNAPATPQARVSTLGAGLSRVWLDGPVHATLDESVPMIGAPEAWAAGYDGTGVNVAILDTGIDATHPDLTGKVVAGRSFVPGVDTVSDDNGHGTHVASTVVGSGAASNGRYRGVAPGADLIIGKVLNRSGNGNESWIIDAMEWATQTEHARIVSMSLGSGQPSDGTDPLSQAVDDLTASTGALFVIAAGNEGGNGARTVSSPGAADAALTVAAVDKSDQLAAFSSRGPRVTNYGMKPDIAAPGVDITAARAAGTALGPIVDEYYTTISGTSMATPHVAGSAAILVQEHPDWTQAQLKAALTSTSTDDGYTVYQQGAGRLDVGAASQATVLAQTEKVDFGRVRYPQTGPAITTPVTYRNDGDGPVTLNLSGTVRAVSGAAAPEGMFTVSPASLVVPAHGTAEATVTLDPTLGGTGLYSGAVLATAAGVSLRIPIGTYKEPEGYELSVSTVPRDDATASVLGPVIIKRVDTDTHRWEILPASGAVSVHLDKGVYSVAQTVVWKDRHGDFDNEAFLVDPQVDLSHDASLTLDTNAAKRLDVGLDRPTEVYSSTMTGWRIPAGSTTPYAVVTLQIPYRVQTWATPTDKATVGRFLFEHNHILGTPQITAEVPGHGRQPALVLHPRYQHYAATIRKLTGRMDLPVVDVGTGSAEEFAKVDVHGRIALIDVGDQAMSPQVGADFAREELANAAGAGATAVFAYGNVGMPIMGNTRTVRSAYPLPTVVLPAEDGTALRDRLADGPVTVRINSQPTIPDMYHLSFLERDAIPSAPHHDLSDRDLATVRSTFHGDRPITVDESWSVSWPSIFQPDGDAASHTAVSVEFIPGPMTHTEHFGPLDGKAAWSRGVTISDKQVLFETDNGHTAATGLGITFTEDVFDRPGFRTEDWNQGPMVPGTPVLSPKVARNLWDGPACSVCRLAGWLPNADMLAILPLGTDGEGHHDTVTSSTNGNKPPDSPGTDEVHLYSGDTELPQHSLLGVPGVFPFYALPQGQAGDYRMTEHFVDASANGGYGNESDTTWTFHSQGLTGRDIPDGYDPIGMCFDKCRVEPLLFLGYQFNLRADNTLPAPGVHAFTVTAYHQVSVHDMPPVAGLRMRASVDGGAHWYPVPAIPLGGGKFRVFLVHPRLAGDTGTVSLRTEAWDTAGDRISQTVTDAYGLVSHHRWPRQPR